MSNTQQLRFFTLLLSWVLSASIYAAADSPSPWGISASASSAKDVAQWFPKMSQAGITQVRLFPEWNGIEREQGKFNWDRADALVKPAAANNLRVTGLLFG